MAEGRAPISSSRIATGDIARHSFAVVRRGFDTDEVRSYLQSVARSLEALEQREQELRAALAEAEERAAHPVVDEATLTASLGQHSAQILRHAHEEAARIVVQAQEGAATCCARRRARSTSCRRAPRRRRPSGSSRWSCWWPTPSRRRGSRASGSSPRRWPRARRSSPAPRTRGGRCSSRSKRPAGGCWPTWRRGGAASGCRSSSCGPPATRWRPRCTGVRDRVDGILTQLDRTDEEARAAAHGGGRPVPPRHGRGAARPGRAGRGDAGRCRRRGRRPAVGARRPAARRGTDGPAPSVDELFARIRAGTAETPEPAAEAEPPTSCRRAGRGRTAADVADPAKAATVRTTQWPTPRRGRGEAPADEPTTAPGPDDAAHRPARRAARRRSRRARAGRSSAPWATTRTGCSTGCAARRRSSVDELMGSEDEHLAAFARRRAATWTRRSPPARCSSEPARRPSPRATPWSRRRRAGPRGGDHVAAAGRGGDGRPGRPRRRRLPRMAGRTGRAAGRRLRPRRRSRPAWPRPARTARCAGW